jgi:hypothetical protein
MEFRIGVNLGDVMVEGEQIYGDGVNVAARWRASPTPAASASRARFTTRYDTGLRSPTKISASRPLRTSSIYQTGEPECGFGESFTRDRCRLIHISGVQLPCGCVDETVDLGLARFGSGVQRLVNIGDEVDQKRQVTTGGPFVVIPLFEPVHIFIDFCRNAAPPGQRTGKSVFRSCRQMSAVPARGLVPHLTSLRNNSACSFL